MNSIHPPTLFKAMPDVEPLDPEPCSEDGVDCYHADDSQTRFTVVRVLPAKESGDVIAEIGRSGFTIRVAKVKNPANPFGVGRMLKQCGCVSVQLCPPRLTVMTLGTDARNGTIAKEVKEAQGIIVGCGTDDYPPFPLDIDERQKAHTWTWTQPTEAWHALTP